MYFIPQKNRWYSFFAHTSMIYRYGALVTIVLIVSLGWRYGLYAWLDASIAHEQAIISQLQNQCVAQSKAEHEHTEFTSQLPILKNSCNAIARDCVGPQCSDQCSYLFELVRKAGMKVTHYRTEKEKKNEFKQSLLVSLGVTGTLEQLQTFLMALKKSCRLIQCPSFSAQRTEGAHYAITAMIQFISPASLDTITT